MVSFQMKETPKGLLQHFIVDGRCHFPESGHTTEATGGKGETSFLTVGFIVNIAVVVVVVAVVVVVVAATAAAIDQHFL